MAVSKPHVLLRDVLLCLQAEDEIPELFHLPASQNDLLLLQTVLAYCCSDFMEAFC